MANQQKLEPDPGSLPATGELAKTHVVMTMVGGKVVFAEMK
jgi:hypothetical protein